MDSQAKKLVEKDFREMVHRLAHPTAREHLMRQEQADLTAHFDFCCFIEQKSTSLWASSF